jgi:hypothetical protein
VADRREVRAAAGVLFAAGADDRGLERGELGLEVLAAEVLVADQDQRLAGLAFAAADHLEADELLVDLWGGERERSGVPSGAERGGGRTPKTWRLRLAQWP